MLRKGTKSNRATHFILKTNGATMVYTFNREELMSMEPDEDLIDKISPDPLSRYIYRWNNGRVGAISPAVAGQYLDFREYKLYDGDDDTLSFPEGLRPVKEGDEDNNECKETLAKGIVAYYLIMMKTKTPKDIFADYLENEKVVFKTIRDTEMRAWDPEYKKVFPYSEHIKQENNNIRFSSRLFDFLGEADIAKIKDMAENYLAFARRKMPRSEHLITWEEEKKWFKEAVLHVMKLKDREGNFIFNKTSQWMAIYRFAVDSGIMYAPGDTREPENPETAQYKVFEDFSHELQLDVFPPTRIPFKRTYIEEMGKENYARYREPYPWSNNGIKHLKSFTLYTELDDVYRELEMEFYKKR